MKTKQVLAVMITSFFLLYGCSNNDDNVEVSGLASNGLSLSKTELASNGLSLSKTELGSKSSVTDQTYPQAQAKVLETFGAIAQSIMLGAGNGEDGIYMDQLISFHAYGDKFTEFNDGKLYDSAGNEENERTFFGETVDPGGVIKFGAMVGTLKVAVYYGNVANLTFISDFHLMIGGDLYIVNNLITLLFVKTNGEWKMVHEHHSPADLAEL